MEEIERRLEFVDLDLVFPLSFLSLEIEQKVRQVVGGSLAGQRGSDGETRATGGRRAGAAAGNGGGRGLP